MAFTVLAYKGSPVVSAVGDRVQFKAPENKILHGIIRQIEYLAENVPVLIEGEDGHLYSGQAFDIVKNYSRW